MTDHPDSPSNSHQSTSFEEGLAQLSEIVGRLESGGLGLSESIAAYESGVTILRQLHTELATVEERVSKLVRIDEEGRPVLEPMSTTEPPSPAAKAGRKAPPRSSSAARKRSESLPGMDDMEGDV
jgi:exodeoxyribonuclease VII small subunit